MNFSFKNIIYVSLFAIGFNQQNAIAQDLESGQQEIIKSFEVTLEDAKMVKIEPKVAPITPSKINYKYQLTIVPLEIKYPAPVIKPLAAEPDDPFTSRSLYSELGFGNLGNPHLLLKYHGTNEESSNYFINLDYNGINGGSLLSHQKYNTGNVDGGFDYSLTDELLLKTKAFGRYDNRHIFYNRSITNRDSINIGKARNTVVFGGSAQLNNSLATDAVVDFSGDFEASLLTTQLSQATETYFKLGGQVGKSAGNWYIDVPFAIRGTLSKNSNNLYTLSTDPYVKYSNKSFWVKLGFGLLNDNSVKFKIFPTLHLDYGLSDKYLHLFVNVDQSFKVNNLHGLTQDNPWMNSKIDTLTSHLTQSFSGGIKGNDNALAYQIEGGFAKHYNLGGYNNFNNPIFATIDLQNVNAVFLRGNIDFALTDHLKFGGLFYKNFFTEKVYGIPSLELKAFGRMGFLKNLFILEPSLFLSDRITAITDNGQVPLNSQVDLNVSAKINIQKNIGLYFDANNILNNKYARYLGYPRVGIHFNGGVIVKI